MEYAHGSTILIPILSSDIVMNHIFQSCKIIEVNMKINSISDYVYLHGVHFFSILLICLVIPYYVHSEGQASEAGLCSNREFAEPPLTISSYYYYETPLSFVFSDGSGKWGFFDKMSGYFQEPCYDAVYDLFCTEAHSPILVAVDDNYGYLDRSSGAVVIPLKYEYCGYYSEFVNGYAVVGKKEASGEYFPILIDEQGNQTIFPEGYYPMSSTFSEAVVVYAMELIDGTWIFKYGLGDVYGKVILEPRYDYISNWSEGYACIRQNGLWGHIDFEGNEVVSPTYALNEEEYGSEGYLFEDGIATLHLLSGATLYIDYAGNELNVVGE